MSGPGTALVTGASAGLGAEFSRQLAAAGHDLVLVARDQDRLSALAAQLREAHGVHVEILPADLSTGAGCDEVAARIDAAERPVDMLVNNAGMGLYRPFGRSDLSDEQRMVDLNVVAVMRLSHAAVAAMTRRGHGRIINISSVGGIMPRPETATYGASKAYVIAFTEALAQLLTDSGVTATVVCPGFTHTEFHSRAEVDMSYLPPWMWLHAGDVVREGLAAAMKGTVVCVPNARYKAMVRASRVLPRGVVRRLARTGRPRSVRSDG